VQPCKQVRTWYQIAPGLGEVQFGGQEWVQRLIGVFHRPISVCRSSSWVCQQHAHCRCALVRGCLQSSCNQSKGAHVTRASLPYRGLQALASRHTGSRRRSTPLGQTFQTACKRTAGLAARSSLANQLCCVKRPSAAIAVSEQKKRCETEGPRSNDRKMCGGSVTKRFLCIPVQSIYECKTRGRALNTGGSP
jgi:hypothetical protein